MIKIIRSNNNTPNKIIYDLIEIEKEVFEPDYVGEYENIEPRFNKYKEMLYLVYDDELLVGYFCFFGISEKLYHYVTSDFNFYDDNISANDVYPIEESKYVYLLSIAIKKKYQSIGIGNNLCKLFFEEVKKNNIEKVISTAISEKGEGLMIKNGFKLIFDNKIDYKIYEWSNDYE